MKKVFIIHGFRGSPNMHWIPWLVQKLNELSIHVVALSMPNPSYPKKDEWVKTIYKAIENPSEEIFLVGHSLGVSAVLRYLESLPDGVHIGGAVLISGPLKLDTPSLLLKSIFIGSFFKSDFSFKKIKKVCDKFVVIHGNNDDRVPFEHGLVISKNLDCELVVVPNGGHLINEHKELPQALNALLEMVK